VLVGIFKPIDTKEELDASGTGYGWGLFLGYHLAHWLGVESEFLYFQGDYETSSDTLLPGTASNAVNMASVDISIRIRASYQVWELRPFLGCGVSYADSDLYTKDAASGLFENTAGNQAASWQVLAGLAFTANKRWRPELVWRWIDLDQEFGIFSNGKVQVGGNMLHLAIVGAY